MHHAPFTKSIQLIRDGTNPHSCVGIRLLNRTFLIVQRARQANARCSRITRSLLGNVGMVKNFNVHGNGKAVTRIPSQRIDQQVQYGTSRRAQNPARHCGGEPPMTQMRTTTTNNTSRTCHR